MKTLLTCLLSLAFSHLATAPAGSTDDMDRPPVCVIDASTTDFVPGCDALRICCDLPPQPQPPAPGAQAEAVPAIHALRLLAAHSSSNTGNADSDATRATDDLTGAAAEQSGIAAQQATFARSLAERRSKAQRAGRIVKDQQGLNAVRNMLRTTYTDSHRVIPSSVRQLPDGGIEFMIVAVDEGVLGADAIHKMHITADELLALFTPTSHSADSTTAEATPQLAEVR